MSGTFSSASFSSSSFSTPVPVYPAEADVRSGVTYGPTGTDYTGTMTGGGSGTVYLRRGR